MIWLVAVLYVWAGVTIGRMCWEFDVYADPPKYERLACWLTGILWWGVLLVALWIHFISPPEDPG